MQSASSSLPFVKRKSFISLFFSVLHGTAIQPSLFGVYDLNLLPFISGDERPHLHVCAIAIVTSVYLCLRAYKLITEPYVCCMRFIRSLSLCCSVFFIFIFVVSFKKKNAFRDLSNVINLPCAIRTSVCILVSQNEFALYTHTEPNSRSAFFFGFCFDNILYVPFPDFWARLCWFSLLRSFSVNVLLFGRAFYVFHAFFMWSRN